MFKSLRYIALLSLIVMGGAAQATPRDQSAEQAITFDYSQHQTQLILSWEMAPGYYLVDGQFDFTPIDVTLTKVLVPPSDKNTNSVLGHPFIHQNRLRVRITLADLSQTSQLQVSYQGCSPSGECARATTQTIYLFPVVNTGPASPHTAKVTANQNGGAQQGPSQALIYAIAMVVGLLLLVYLSRLHKSRRSIGARQMAPVLFGLAILAGLLYTPPSPKVKATPGEFIRVTTLAALLPQLKLAQADNKQVMLDFYARWCTACQVFDTQTLTDPDVTNELADKILIKADVTHINEHSKRLMQHFSVVSLPATIFFNANGEELRQARVSTFLDAEAFRAHLLLNSL
jgi:thiol:disulfide interchange protein